MSSREQLLKAESSVAYREKRLARAEQSLGDHPAYVQKCRENLENAKWSLRLAAASMDAA